MKYAKIIMGRNSQSVHKKLARERRSDADSGADVEYFLLPNKRADESLSKYANRIWRMNKRAFFSTDSEDWPLKARTYANFKEEILSRMEYMGEKRKAQGLRDAIRSQIRARITPGEQLAMENTKKNLKKIGAWNQFVSWTRGMGPFNVAKMSYSSQEGRYTYGGKVSFGWKYYPATKDKPGGLVFTITNLETGKTYTGEDLQEAWEAKQMKEQGFDE